MKIWVLLIVAICIGFDSFSQTRITGTVTDRFTGKPISDVNLVLKGTVEGASSDAEGKFSLTVSRLPATLVASEIRYYTEEFTIDRPQFNIRLAPKIQTLAEVTIQAERIQCIHPDEGIYAYDFEFYDDLILILTFKKTKKESVLYLCDDAGNTIARKPLQKFPESLYRDRLGYVHLLTVDSAYQIYYDYQSLHLLYPTEKVTFLAMIYPVMARYRDQLILNTPGYRGLISQYYAVGNKMNREFYRISDSTKLSYLRVKYDLGYFVRMRNLGGDGPLVSLQTIRENLDFFRQSVGLDWLDGKILAPVFAPIHKIHDTLVLFDFTHSEVVLFNERLEVDHKTPITFHQMKKWKKELIIDETWEDIYTCYQQDGITRISRLDRNTFKPVSSTEVEDMIFIDKLKIRNGHAYFLFKDYCSNSKRMIYKMML